MNQKIQRSLAVVSAAALVFGVAAAQTSANAAPKTVYIAYQGPLSGGEASTGTDEQNAVKYAIKLFNAKNKATYNVKLVSVDDQGDPAVAGTVAPGIGKNKAILGVVGAAYSGASIASLPFYKAGGLVMISPSATRVSLTDSASPDFGGPVFHRVVGKDDLQGPALAKYATAGVTNAKVFIFDDQSSYAVPLAGYVKGGLAKVAGATVVGTDSVPNTTTDFSPTIAKIKTSGATVVIYTGYYSQAAVFIKQLRDSGSKIVFASGDGTLDNQFVKLARKAAEGALLSAPAIPMETASPKLAAEMVKMGMVPGVYTTESYDAANFFLEAIKAGNSDRASINKYVSTKSSKGLSKTLKFDADGEVSGADVNGFVIKNGKIVLLGAIKA